MKRLLTRISNHIAEHPVETMLSVICYILLLSIFMLSLNKINLRMNHELADIASCDANLFFTVGRGMLIGKRPYLDYYENKPPMIFLISAISYAWTGDFHMVNVDSFLCCINLLVLTFIIGPILGWKRKWKAFPTALATLLLGSCGILFMLYAEFKAGEIMTELFGASAMLDAIFCLLLIPKDKKVAFYDPRVILSGFFFGIAVMFKEPFAFMGVFSFLFIIEKKEDLLNKFIFPGVYGVLTAIIILLVTNSFVGYFQVYIPNMFGHHIEIYGSVWDRMGNVNKLFDNLASFHWSLRVVVVACFAVSSFRGVTMQFSENFYVDLPLRLLRALLPLTYLYVASFCVGLGGQYWWHHYAFAMPFYYGLLIDSAILIGDTSSLMSPLSFQTEEEKKKSYSSFLHPLVLAGIAVSVSFSLISGYGVRKYEWTDKEDKMISFIVDAKAAANYVDEVLDALNEEEYLYVGFNGDSRLYCYTKHMPMGPSFVQDPNNFYSNDTFFAKAFVEEMEATNLVVVQAWTQGVLINWTKQYLKENFTTTLPAQANGIQKPSSFSYVLYSRKGVF